MPQPVKQLKVPPSIARDMYISRTSSVCFRVAVAVYVLSVLSALAAVVGFFLILLAWLIVGLLVIMTFGAFVMAAPELFDTLGNADGIANGMFSFVGVMWRYTAPIGIAFASAAFLFCLFKKRRSVAVLIVSVIIIVSEIIIITVNSAVAV